MKCFYYGNVGKREAVRRFLENLAQTEKPVTPLLYSDEDITWLAEDAAFTHHWMELLTAANMASRYGDEWLMDRITEAKRHYMDLFSRNYTVTELLHLPEPKLVKTGGVPFPLCDLSGIPGLTYTAAEFVEHLRGVAALLISESHYHVVLTDQIPADIIIHSKDGVGALVFPAAPPTTAFAIKEQSLTSAIWEYLRRATAAPDKARTIIALETYIEELESLCTPRL